MEEKEVIENKDNKEFILKAVSKNGKFLDLASEELKNDKDVVTLELIHRKYRIHLKKCKDNYGNEFYIIKSAYYYTNPKELIDFENQKYLNNAYSRRNAIAGVSATPCIDNNDT